MTPKNMNIVEFLKTLRPKDLVYSGILVLFIIMVVIIFFISTTFISQNINKIFSSDGGASAQVLDIARYELTMKKLGVATAPNSENSTVPEVIAPPVEAPATAVPTTTPLDKQALSIQIRNSTAKKGVAGTLANLLKDSGFKTPSTANEKMSYSKTTIFIKESKYVYAPLLLETVLKSYPDAFATTTPESALFDVIIIVGGK